MPNDAPRLVSRPSFTLLRGSVRGRGFSRLLELGLLLVPMLIASTSAIAQRSVSDLTGREVTVPSVVSRIATLGAVAPLNSFLFMLGKGAVIANGLPRFFQTPYWTMQRRLAPGLASLPVVAAADGQANREALLALAPEIVLASTRGSAAPIEAAGLPVLYFEWNDFGDLLRSAELLGTVLHVESKAGEFRRYCEHNVERVAAARPVSVVRPALRPRAAFLRMKSLSQPARIADWTLEAGGGENVGRHTLANGQAAMTQEMLLRADPEVLIVWSREERDALLVDSRYAQMTAVRRQQVYAVPVGATPWLAPGAEQCLGLLWVAQRLDPVRFRHIDLIVETRDFYRRFYGIEIDASEAAAILAGMN